MNKTQMKQQDKQKDQNFKALLSHPNMLPHIRQLKMLLWLVSPVTSCFDSNISQS